MRQTLYTVFGMLGFMAALGFARGNVKGPATFALHFGCAVIAAVGTVVLIILDIINRQRPRKGPTKRKRRRTWDERDRTVRPGPNNRD